MPLDVAVATFDHIEGAERAYAKVRERDPAASWLSEVAFVELHRKGRVVVRGTIAGHYVDVDDQADFMGTDTGIGALAGAAVGVAFGPLGLAVGFTVGGTVGGVVESRHIPKLEGSLYDEIRADVPEKSSAVVVFAPPADVDAVVAAFQDTNGHVIRHRLTDEAVAELQAAVAGAPLAAPSPGRE